MKLDDYLNRDDLMRITGWGNTAVTRMLRGMEASGRYPPDDFIKTGKLLLIHPHVLADWADYKERKKKGGIVPPYKKGR